MPSFNIDGVTYQVDSLSEAVKAQVRSLQFVEAQLQQLRNEVAVYETARATYLEALKAEIQPAGPAEGVRKTKPKTKGRAQSS